MDVYRDYFTRETLAVELAQAPYTPGQLGASGMFEVVPLNSTTLAIEEQTKDAGKILTPIPRGAPRQQTNLDKRKVHTFTTQSFGDEGTVYADEVLNARGRGAAVEILTDRRNRVISRLRRDMDLTHESLRMATLLSPATTEFGARGATVQIILGTDTTKTRAEIFNKIILPVEAALDGLTYSDIDVWCSDGFWDDLIENKSIKDTYLNWQAAADLRGNLGKPFRWGDVNWIRYRGVGTTKITADKAVVVPKGVPGFGYAGFAPNDTLESVGEGALGAPYYLGSKVLTDSQGTKGWEISIQSHPKFVIARPSTTFEIGL